jgi:hypothetical protein
MVGVDTTCVGKGVCVAVGGNQITVGVGVFVEGRGILVGKGGRGEIGAHAVMQNINPI